MGNKNPFKSDVTSSSACLFTFPFPIYIDTQDYFGIEEVKFQGVSIRLYPFFRSGAANFIPAPNIDPSQIPLPNGQNGISASQSYFPQAAAILSMVGEPNCGTTLTVGPSWQDVVQRYFPMDSMRVDVLGTDIKGKHSYASNVVQRILGWVKVKTNQWWIGNSFPSGGTAYLRHVIPISRKGHFRSRPEHQGFFTTMRGDEVPLDSYIWKQVLRNVLEGVWPEDFDYLYVYAKYHTVVNEYRFAVINLAVACEQAIDKAFMSIVQKQNKKFKKGQYYTGNDLRKHINRDLEKLIGRKFEDENPMANDGISKLWNTRGDLAHGANAQVSKEEIRDMDTATYVCIEWLKDIAFQYNK